LKSENSFINSSIFKKIKDEVKNNYLNLIKFFIKVIFLFLVRIVTTYSFFILKTSVSLTIDIHNLLLLNREDFKALYSNFIYNVITRYSSSLDFDLENKKIKFDGVVYNNPKTPINKPSFANSFVNGFTRVGLNVNYRMNTSELMKGTIINGNGKQIHISQIESENLNYEIDDEKNNFNQPLSPTINEPTTLNKKIVLSHDDLLDKQNTRNHYIFSGYTDNQFKDYTNKDIYSKVSQKKFDLINSQYGEGKLTPVPVFISDSKNTILIDATKSIQQSNSISDKIALKAEKYFYENNITTPQEVYKQKFDAAKEIAIKYNNLVYEYEFVDRTNKLILKETNRTLRDII
jgi:hypothetical protein